MGAAGLPARLRPQAAVDPACVSRLRLHQAAARAQTRLHLLLLLGQVGSICLTVNGCLVRRWLFSQP